MSAHDGAQLPVAVRRVGGAVQGDAAGARRAFDAEDAAGTRADTGRLDHRALVKVFQRILPDVSPQELRGTLAYLAATDLGTSVTFPELLKSLRAVRVIHAGATAASSTHSAAAAAATPPPAASPDMDVWELHEERLGGSLYLVDRDTAVVYHVPARADHWPRLVGPAAYCSPRHWMPFKS